MNSLGMPSGPQALLFFSLLMLFISSCMVNILLRSRLGGELLIMGVFMLSVPCEKRLEVFFPFLSIEVFREGCRCFIFTQIVPGIPEVLYFLYGR